MGLPGFLHNLIILFVDNFFVSLANLKLIDLFAELSVGIAQALEVFDELVRFLNLRLNLYHSHLIVPVFSRQISVKLLIHFHLILQFLHLKLSFSSLLTYFLGISFRNPRVQPFLIFYTILFLLIVFSSNFLNVLL